jgi:hypothetical protein
MTVRVLVSGVDRLELSASGVVPDHVWPVLESARVDAESSGQPVPFEFARSGRRLLMHGQGFHGRRYKLTGGDYVLGLGGSPRWLPAYVQLYSAHVHAHGPERASELFGELLAADVFASPFELLVSRVDIYADSQGWRLDLEDVRRFVSRARSRQAKPVAEHWADAWTFGREWSGFRFGRDALLVRVYDKTREIKGKPVVGLPERWGEWDDSQPVWRVEFQYRRDALRRWRVARVDEVLATLQDLWEYGTKEWMTLRLPTANRQPTRWPVDPVWRELQAVQIRPVRMGLRPGNVLEGNREAALVQLQGHVTHYASLVGTEELGDTVHVMRHDIARYHRERGRTFRDEVRRKRARLLEPPPLMNRQAGRRSGRMVRTGGVGRLRHGGWRWRALNGRTKGRRRADRRRFDQRTPKGGESI